MGLRAVQRHGRTAGVTGVVRSAWRDVACERGGSGGGRAKVGVARSMLVDVDVLVVPGQGMA
jgi:hypothetical protein